MRLLTGLVLLFALGAQCACASPPPPPRLPAPAPLPDNHHPILGIWKLTVADTNCSEVYRFRGDGTSMVTSADEVSESEYNIPSKPSEKGYYKLEDKIVKGNGKQDCSGEVMKVGNKVTNFVRFHPSGILFLMCAAESMDTCIGPFERVLGQDI